MNTTAFPQKESGRQAGNQPRTKYFVRLGIGRQCKTPRLHGLHSGLVVLAKTRPRKGCHDYGWSLRSTIGVALANCAIRSGCSAYMFPQLIPGFYSRCRD